MRRPQSKSSSASESGWDGEVMIIYGPFDAKRLNGNDEKKGLLRPDFFPPSKMKFRTEIEEFCVVRRGVITRQRLTSRRSLSLALCILITPLSVEQSSTRGKVALLTCGNKVETCWRPGLKLSFEFQFSHYLALIEPWHAFSAGKGRSERQTFKAAFRRIFSPDAFLTALAPVSLGLFTLRRPHFGLALQGVLSCRYPHFISRESFSLFSGSFRAVYRPKYARFLPPTLHSYSRYSDEYSFHMKCPACSSLSYTGNLDNLLHSALSSEALCEVYRYTRPHGPEVDCLIGQVFCIHFPLLCCIPS